MRPLRSRRSRFRASVSIATSSSCERTGRTGASSRPSVATTPTPRGRRTEDASHSATTTGAASSSPSWISAAGRVRDLGEGFNPDWSPDGKRLVFLDAEGFSDLVVMNADGTGRRNLGIENTDIADETDPAWSPDGRRIAFVGGGLYVVGADGRNLRRIRPEGYGGSATWSPDGRRIVFDCVGQRFEVCVVRSNGKGLRGLTSAGRNPNWSPRGGLIALTQGEGSSPVVVVRPDGRVVRRVRGELRVRRLVARGAQARCRARNRSRSPPLCDRPGGSRPRPADFTSRRRRPVRPPGHETASGSHFVAGRDGDARLRC